MKWQKNPLPMSYKLLDSPPICLVFYFLFAQQFIKNILIHIINEYNLHRDTLLDRTPAGYCSYFAVFSVSF